MAAYTRCLRGAGAPRRPASGSELSLHILSWHAVPWDPGESEHRQFQTAMSAWSSPRIDRLGIPNDPAIRFTREVNFGATWFTQSLRPASLLAPLYGSDRYSGRPPGAFTSRLSTGRSPFPLLDMTTTATGPPLLAGLSPARMTACVAAPIRSPRRRGRARGIGTGRTGTSAGADPQHDRVRRDDGNISATAAAP